MFSTRYHPSSSTGPHIPTKMGADAFFNSMMGPTFPPTTFPSFGSTGFGPMSPSVMPPSVMPPTPMSPTSSPLWSQFCADCARIGSPPSMLGWNQYCASCGTTPAMTPGFPSSPSMMSPGWPSSFFPGSSFSGFPMTGFPSSSWNYPGFGGFGGSMGSGFPWTGFGGSFPYSSSSWPSSFPYPGWSSSTFPSMPSMGGMPPTTMKPFGTTTPYGYPGSYVPPSETFGRTGSPAWGSVYTSDLGLLPLRPSTHAEYMSMLSPIHYDTYGNRFFSCCFDMRGFRPDEVCVDFDAKSRCIVVRAGQESTVKEEGHSIKRHYERKYCIPEDLRVDVSKLDFKSYLTNDGVLWVEATLPRLSLEEARTGIYPTYGSYPSYMPNVYPISVKCGGGDVGGRREETGKTEGTTGVRK